MWQGYTNIIIRTHKELDLTRQEAVERSTLHQRLFDSISAVKCTNHLKTV